VKIEYVIKKPVIKIVLFLYQEGEVRYRDLADLIYSRGTLTNNINSLEEEELIQRRVETSKPPKSFYSLTDKGEQIARYLYKVNQLLR